MKSIVVTFAIWDKEEYERQHDAFRQAIDEVLGRLIAPDVTNYISTEDASELNSGPSASFAGEIATSSASSGLTVAVLSARIA